MQAVTRNVDALSGCDAFRLILVQIDSPFYKDNPELEYQSDISGSRFRWKDSIYIECTEMVIT